MCGLNVSMPSASSLLSVDLEIQKEKTNGKDDALQKERFKGLSPWELYLLDRKPIIAPDGYIPNSVVRKRIQSDSRRESSQPKALPLSTSLKYIPPEWTLQEGKKDTNHLNLRVESKTSDVSKTPVVPTKPSQTSQQRKQNKQTTTPPLPAKTLKMAATKVNAVVTFNKETNQPQRKKSSHVIRPSSPVKSLSIRIPTPISRSTTIAEEEHQEEHQEKLILEDDLEIDKKDQPELVDGLSENGNGAKAVKDLESDGSSFQPNAEKDKPTAQGQLDSHKSEEVDDGELDSAKVNLKQPNVNNNNGMERTPDSGITSSLSTAAIDKGMFEAERQHTDASDYHHHLDRPDFPDESDVSNCPEHSDLADHPNFLVHTGYPDHWNRSGHPGHVDYPNLPEQVGHQRFTEYRDREDLTCFSSSDQDITPNLTPSEGRGSSWSDDSEPTTIKVNGRPWAASILQYNEGSDQLTRDYNIQGYSGLAGHHTSLDSFTAHDLGHHPQFGANDAALAVYRNKKAMERGAMKHKFVSSSLPHVPSYPTERNVLDSHQYPIQVHITEKTNHNKDQESVRSLTAKRPRGQSKDCKNAIHYRNRNISSPRGKRLQQNADRLTRDLQTRLTTIRKESCPDDQWKISFPPARLSDFCFLEDDKHHTHMCDYIRLAKKKMHHYFSISKYLANRQLVEMLTQTGRSSVTRSFYVRTW